MGSEEYCSYRPVFTTGVRNEKFHLLVSSSCRPESELEKLLQILLENQLLKFEILLALLVLSFELPPIVNCFSSLTIFLEYTYQERECSGNEASSFYTAHCVYRLDSRTHDTVHCSWWRKVVAILQYVCLSRERDETRPASYASYAC